MLTTARKRERVQGVIRLCERGVDNGVKTTTRKRGGGV